KISISGKYANEEKYEFNVGFNDVNIPDVLKMIRKNYQLSGKIFGETQVSKWNSKPILFSDIRIFDGQIGDFSAHQLSGKVSFFDNRWLISGINTKSELGNVELSGWINSSVDSANSIVFLPDDSLSIKTTFQDFQIESIKEIIPWDFETDGKLSGDLHITGQLSNYDLESDFVILNPVFDQINGKEARGQIIYNDKKLYFKETQLDMNSGKYFISGFIPVDLDYFSFDRSKVFENPMDLMISGKTEELEFFYPYFDIIDSLICDCSLQLSLEGPFKEPVRNGQAVISDGKVNITPLNNSFTEIDGLITIDDNQLIISKLEGKSYNPESEDILKTPLDYLSKIFHIAQESEQKPKNIEVSGTMDLTEFFHPNFNVSAKGKNIFIEDSQDEFSGSGLADIFISGKDTIFISGTFEPDPYEFTISPVMTSESTLSKVYETGGIHILYDLHIPLDNGVIIKNEFMEIEIEGEITLTAIDEEEFVLSGSIDIVEGSFFLNGNEFSETEGRILFDPGSDYPTVDIFAYTFIAGQAYKVFFSGPLNNPVIGFESEDPTDPYSQDEILRILLAGDESLVAGNDFKIQDAGTNILSNYLESELERLITARSPVDKFQLKSQGALFRDINNMNVNLYVGKRMSRKLYMNVKSDIFSDQIKNEYEITYRMDKNQSIVVRLDEEGFPHLNYRVKYKY
ncbi:MAG: translocation/assembly module TamB domain-containing protein, partial [Fidelibacterota bacterium]